VRKEMRRILSGAYGSPSKLRFSLMWEDGTKTTSDPGGVQMARDGNFDPIVSLPGHAPFTAAEAALIVGASGAPVDRQRVRDALRR
jgi:hypothetical protein